MYLQLPDSIRKLKRTVYYTNAGISVEVREGEPEPVVDPKELEVIAGLSELTYQSSIEQLHASLRHVEAALVNKVSISVSMSLPNLPHERVEHALFAKQLFMAGELSFRQYVEKMENLFPDRMATLQQGLQDQIAERLAQ